MRPPSKTNFVVQQPLERDIQAKGNRYARARGWLAFKFESPGNAGVPDFIYLRKGRCIMVEWKRPGNKPTALQNLQIGKIRSENVDVFVLDNCEPAMLSLVFD